MDKLQDILKFTIGYLEKRGVEKARLEGEKIISHVLGLDRILLYANFEMELKEEEMIKNALSAPLHEGAVRYYKERGWM